MQIVHTTIIMGTIYQIADEDIYIDFSIDFNIDSDLKSESKSKFGKIIEDSALKHGLAFLVHVAICTKRLTLIAARNGHGTHYIGYAKPNVDQNQCIVGMYNKIDMHTPVRKGKKFNASLTMQTLRLLLGNLYFDVRDPDK